MVSEKATDGFILAMRDTEATYHVEADYYMVDNIGNLVFMDDLEPIDGRAERGRIMLSTFAAGTWLQVSDAAKWGDDRVTRSD